MLFRLPRQILDEKMEEILAREVRRQRVYVVLANGEKLKQIASVCQDIMQRGLPKELVRKKLPNGLGYGIFLHPKAKAFERGQIIGPYSGVVALVPQNAPNDSLYAFEPLNEMRLTKEEQAHFDPKRKYHPQRLYAMHVDAEKKGNFTRFINHSDQPNLIAQFFKIPKNKYGLEPSCIEVIYVVKKRIHPGEQLLVSYEGEESSYWSTLDIQPLPITPRTYILICRGKASVRLEEP